MTEVDPENWVPEYKSWRHGGWYVVNVRYPTGAVGCVSNNYADKKWRIVCDKRSGDFTYPNRDAAARAEYELVQELGAKDSFTAGEQTFTRNEALILIWRHTHPDFKSRRVADGKRTILVNRGGEGTCLVELDALTAADIADKLPYAVSCEARRRQPALPDSDEITRLHELLDHAKNHGDVTPNGVAFNWWLANADGAGYELLREPHHSDDEIDAAKRNLRNEHDVVTLRVVRVPPLPGDQKP